MCSVFSASSKLNVFSDCEEESRLVDKRNIISVLGMFFCTRPAMQRRKRCAVQSDEHPAGWCKASKPFIAVD
jgi:hypothetical protein